MCCLNGALVQNSFKKRKQKQKNSNQLTVPQPSLHLVPSIYKARQQQCYIGLVIY